MIAVGAIVSLDGTPVEGADLAALASSLASSHQSYSRTWLDDGIGLAVLSADAIPALVAIDGRSIVADARLDNRDELLAATRPRDPHLGDAALILAAYDKWGDSCPARLEGDFSFIIWDGPARTLVAARDVFGVRPLVYARANGRLIMATTVGALARTLTPRPPINRPLIQDFLDNRFDRWTTETAFDGIFRLAPAHSLVVRNGVVSVRRYHVLGSRGAERLPRDEDYLARFRELLARAVAARMRGGMTAGVNLSGGMDSSAVALHAVHEARRSAQTVRSYTSTYPPDPNQDEEPFARSVVAMYPGLVASFQSQETQWAFQEFRPTADQDTIDEPELTINRTVMMARLKQAHSDGCHVVLSGGFGDQLLTGWYTLAGVLPDIGWRRLPRELPYFRRDRSTVATVAGAIARRVAWRFPPFSTRRRRLFSAELLPPRLPSEAAIHAYARLTRGTASMAHLQMSQTTRAAGVPVAFPYLDRSLVEFTLHLPIHLRFQQGVSKFILRRAHESELPPMVRNRLWGTSLWPSSQNGVARERALIESTLTGSRLVSLGFRTGAEVSALLSAYDAAPATLSFQRIYRAVSLERWLCRQRFT